MSLLVIMVLAAAGAGIHAAKVAADRRQPAVSQGQGQNPAGGQTAGTDAQRKADGSQGKAGGKDLAADGIQGVLRSIDEENKTIIVYQIARTEEVELRYNGATAVKSKHGSDLTMPQIRPGTIIRTAVEPDSNFLISVQEDTESWIYKGIGNLLIDRINSTMMIGDTLYRYDDKLTVVNADKLVSLENVSEKDLLTARGIEGKIYSIQVEKGHGTLTFTNYDEFIGGSIEVGYEVFDQIRSEMEYVLREGSYKLILRNGDLAVNKYITISRDQTLLMDLNEYRSETGKSGLVYFSLNPVKAELYLDNELVEPDGPVKLGYGEYILEVKCDGYEPLSRVLTVSMPTMNIRIDLADGSKTTGGDALTDPDVNGSSGSGGEKDGSDDGEIEEIGDPEENEDPEDDGGIEEIGGEEEDTGGDEDEESGDNKSEVPEGGVVIADHYIMIRRPEGASVYFDGKYVGVAPLQIEKVTGEHKITFKRDGYISKTYTIEVENDKENPQFSFPELTKE